MEGSNSFGGVLIATHKSINVPRITKFDKVPNRLVLEIGTVPDKFELVACYSPPAETIPLELFDYTLQNNPNTIFTDDFSAEYIQETSLLAHDQRGGESQIIQYMHTAIPTNLTKHLYYPEVHSTKTIRKIQRTNFQNNLSIGSHQECRNRKSPEISMSHLTSKHWIKLKHTKVDTNPNIVENYL